MPKLPVSYFPSGGSFGVAPGSVGSLVRSRKLAGIALAAGLAIGGLTASTAAAATSSCGGSGAVSTLNATLQDGATYTIQCPAGEIGRAHV